MAHRVFRLSICPERAPEVRRVLDFDGRSSLHEVHRAIQREFELDDDHLHAFYLSGRYFDRSSEHGASPDSRHDSQRSMLFRLGLKPGQQFAYLFDFGDELRHAVTVVAITEVEAPLRAPVLVESVGEAPSQYDDIDEDAVEPYALPETLAELAPLAESVLTLGERLDALDEEIQDGDSEDDSSGHREAVVSLFRELSKAALDLARELHEDNEALQQLDEWSHDRELLPRLLDLPLELVSEDEFDSALAVARAFAFADAESFSGDMAIIFAESDKRDEAIAQLDTNLKQFPESYLTAVKSGVAFEALGDLQAAEAAYRRAMTSAEDRAEEESARDLLLELLEDMGRFEEIDALGSLLQNDAPRVQPKPFAGVGRNDICPCGSGKKYKKCHGA